MIRNYIKLAFRSLIKNKTSSFVNITGLSVGMAVTILIGLWIFDELSHNKNHQNYDRVAQVWLNSKWNGNVRTQTALPFPLGNELRTNFRDDFRYISMSSWTGNYILAYGDKKLIKTGNAVEPDFTEMLTLKMLKGSRNGLKDPSSIMLSESVTRALFGDTDPINKVLKVDNSLIVKVTGVYEDLPRNSTFSDILFMIPWDLFATQEWIKSSSDNWNQNGFQLYVQLNANTGFADVSSHIKNIIKTKQSEQPVATQELFLHPMIKWHLHSAFKNGVNVGGRIEFIYLFGVIGLFVLLLACINFMNLSTARSEKRAKEVGIRKATGSLRKHLIIQFLSESICIALLAFTLAMVLCVLVMPAFNSLTGKQIVLPVTNSGFWVLGLGFTLFTGLLAGSYPAFYLSSFNPVQALKGTFKVGRLAVVPRKVLVVLQFTISVTLIIGTIVVFLQINHAKDRAVGYNRSGLIYVNMSTPEIYDHYQALENDLLASGAVAGVCKSSSEVTGMPSSNTGFEWAGKDPNQNALLATIGCSLGYGQTVGLQFIEGRDFSEKFVSDSSALILNQAAIRLMSLQNPIGKTIKWFSTEFRVIGVVKDMVMTSPYESVAPTAFLLRPNWAGVVNVRINPNISTSEALKRISSVFEKHDPGSPFDYTFADQEYARKFDSEERIGTLAALFACLAILISCLGLFGLASFIAEQRTKEIGIRKVLGASVFNLWRLLSTDFVRLVLISLLISIPIAYYFMFRWLQNFEYRTGLSWWIFASAAISALTVTLLTVSFKAIKTAIANPVKSLRTE